MSDSCRQRRKRRYEWLNRLSRADRSESNLDEMLRRVLESPEESAKACQRCSNQSERVSITQSKDLGTSEKSEPLVDVFEDEESVIVVTQLTGIDKSNVDLHTTQDKLTISVNSPEGEHCREVQLPAKVDVGSSSSRLKNGVLEIRLKKLGEELVVR